MKNQFKIHSLFRLHRIGHLQSQMLGKVRFLARRHRGGVGGARRGRGRGFTLVEMLISIAITTFVMSMVTVLMIDSAKAVKDVFGQAYTRNYRMAALDQIRYVLGEARIGTVAYSDPDSVYGGNKTVTFTHPVWDDANSKWTFVTGEFQFTEAGGGADSTLTYTEDTANPDVHYTILVIGTLTVNFQDDATYPTNVVQVSVKTSSASDYGEVDTEDGVMDIYLRNV